MKVSELTTGSRDMSALLAMSKQRLSQGAEITSEEIRECVDSALATIRSSKASPTAKNRAQKIVAMFRKMDVDVALKMIDKVEPDQVEVTHNVGEQTRRSVQEALRHPEYAEFLRQRDMGEDCDAGQVCAVDKRRDGHAVANGEAPRGA